MNDVRQLLKNKEYIEKMMQRADPLMRLVMQRRLDVVCKEIEEARAREDLNKPLEPQEIDLLKQRVAELEASNEELLELLEFCCYRTTSGADCWCQHGQGLVKLGHCSEESYCPVWQGIQKAKGQNNENKKLFEETWRV